MVSERSEESDEVIQRRTISTVLTKNPTKSFREGQYQQCSRRIRRSHSEKDNINGAHEESYISNILELLHSTSLHSDTIESQHIFLQKTTT